ncbi:manganese efflux pump MntP [Gemmobacter serpentinus]|uniref:manganese efflux pump MntP n=1 Tax=Gemmobacter serpentinus TaxID=2652247 RepID=UPI00124ED701|nr:manganese efflux pump MntP family protein [Gemmobacter serpentinus]
MTPISIGVLAVGMSVDAFIASVGRGAQAGQMRFGPALRAGAVFGVIEAITPLIGWGIGSVANDHVDKFDHWIAFGLLAMVGLHMVWQALTRKVETTSDAGAGGGTGWTLIATAVGTSIDAMAVGVSLAFLNVNIVIVALAIGLATMSMSTMGMLLGRRIGSRFGRIAEVVGGFALTAIGLAILVDHLS